MKSYFDYLRSFSSELGSRILEMYPPLQGPNDPIAPELKTLLRRPLPAQAMTITGCAKYLDIENSVRVVGECGTGKTLMTVGIAHAHAKSRPYTGIVMCPPHLVLKWAREIMITIPRARVFVVYDFRNGGDPDKPHGIVEAQMRNGHVRHQGIKMTLSALRAMGRKGWRKQCSTPSYFIVSRETGKLSYFWKHAYTITQFGKNLGVVKNPDTGRTIPASDGGFLSSGDFANAKRSETFARPSEGGRTVPGKNGRFLSSVGPVKAKDPETLTQPHDGSQVHSALWQADRSKIQRMAPLEYISRYMKGFWDYAIADELHQLANDTAQGDNLDVLRRCARKIIGDTGTLMGGYASDLFRIFFRMEPRKMVEAGFDATSHGESEFQSIFGVLETIETIPDADNACSRAGKSTARLVRRPGASPLLFGKFLMSSTVFVTLEDIAEYLPPYEESVLEVDMDEPLQEAYKKIEKDIRRAITENKRNLSLISLALQRLLL